MTEDASPAVCPGEQVRAPMTPTRGRTSTAAAMIHFVDRLRAARVVTAPHAAIVLESCEGGGIEGGNSGASMNEEGSCAGVSRTIRSIEIRELREPKGWSCWASAA